MLLQTLDRGLALLEWVASHPETATVRSAASALGINLNSCYHLVSTLSSRGYVAKTGKGGLRLGPAMFELWSWFLRSGGQEDLVMPTFKELHGRLQETLHLAVWDGKEVAVVATLEGPQQLTVSGRVGRPEYPHRLSAGKAILAYLDPQQLDHFLRTHQLAPATPGQAPMREEDLRAELAEVAATGLGSDLDNVFPGICSVGAPFFGPNANVVGAFAVSTPAVRYYGQQDRIERELFAAAEKASRRLGYHGDYPVLRTVR